MNGIITEGLSLMVIGMGTVLMFLCILIASMHIMAAVVGWLNKVFPEPVTQSAGTKTAVKKDSSNDEEIAVAILAAITKR